MVVLEIDLIIVIGIVVVVAVAVVVVVAAAAVILVGSRKQRCVARCCRLGFRIPGFVFTVGCRVFATRIQRFQD